MDFQKIKYFVSVARHLSFTKGAKECHVSQTVISRQIASMEEELGVSLFLRSGHKIQLTLAGDAFYCDAVFMLQHYKGVVERVKKIEPGIKGSLTIGFGPLEFGLLEKLLPQFCNKYPNIIVNCQQFSYNALPFRYTRGLLDVVFATEKCAKSFLNMSEHFEVFPNNWYIIAHESHAYWQLNLESQERLLNQNLIVLENDFDDEYEYKCIKQNFKIKNFIQTNFWQAQMLMVESQRGVAFVPEFLIPSLPLHIKSKPILLNNIESSFIMARRTDNINPCLDIFVSFANTIFNSFDKKTVNNNTIIPLE